MRFYYYGSKYYYIVFTIYVFKTGVIMLNDDFVTVIKLVHSHFVLFTLRRNESKENTGGDEWAW